MIKFCYFFQWCTTFNYVMLFQGMYSCCSFEDETAPGGPKSLPAHHHSAMVTVPSQSHVVSTSMTNPAIALTQQQQPPQPQQAQPVYKTPLPGSPPTVMHSGATLGPSNNPIAGAPLPCSTFLPRPDRSNCDVSWNYNLIMPNFLRSGVVWVTLLLKCSSMHRMMLWYSCLCVGTWINNSKPQAVNGR